MSKIIVILVTFVSLIVVSVGCCLHSNGVDETENVQTIVATAPAQTQELVVQEKQDLIIQATAERSDIISVTGENRNQIAEMIAKTMYREGRGIKSKTELACVAWTILNRVDAGAGNVYSVITQRHQFAYSSSAPTVSDYGYDLVELAHDVIERWEREHAGEENVGRVLPKNYLWYGGHSGHNWFRCAYNDFSNPWNYALPTPYEN
jgi:hypothetical protein